MGWMERIRERTQERAEQRAEADYRARVLESLATADLATLALAMEDRGWLRLGGPVTDNNNDFSPLDRVQQVLRSRGYWQRDPLVKQATRLYTAYALGRGIELRHADKAAQTAL